MSGYRDPGAEQVQHTLLQCADQMGRGLLSARQVPVVLFWSRACTSERSTDDRNTRYQRDDRGNGSNFFSPFSRDKRYNVKKVGSRYVDTSRTALQTTRSNTERNIRADDSAGRKILSKCTRE